LGTENENPGKLAQETGFDNSTETGIERIAAVGQKFVDNQGGEIWTQSKS
jgi:hypothetical protein